ncbi:MAG: TetR/AcrR family transcriptional regulator [Desulfobacteraceae bacterium]|nr:TetR/AcrR family transcriptional regulator [Desulfobacteraceae bacterium]
MPPKTKFKRETIIDIAFDYVRNNGWSGLTARYLSEQLNSSTMPIYSCFKSMAHLEDEVVKKAMELFYEYITTPRSKDIWTDHGVGYILFAVQENYLFRAVFDKTHDHLRQKYSGLIWERTGKDLSLYPLFKELSDNQIDHLRKGRWVLVHGMASLISTGALPIADQKEIPNLVKTASKVLFSGVKANFE